MEEITGRVIFSAGLLCFAPIGGNTASQSLCQCLKSTPGEGLALTIFRKCYLQKYKHRYTNTVTQMAALQHGAQVKPFL